MSLQRRLMLARWNELQGTSLAQGRPWHARQNLTKQWGCAKILRALESCRGPFPDIGTTELASPPREMRASAERRNNGTQNVRLGQPATGTGRGAAGLPFRYSAPPAPSTILPGIRALGLDAEGTK